MHLSWERSLCENEIQNQTLIIEHPVVYSYCKVNIMYIFLSGIWLLGYKYDAVIAIHFEEDISLFYT